MHQRTWTTLPSQTATGRQTPSKPRVLVEESAAASQVSDFSLFRQAGFDVAFCSGPDDAKRCPLVEGEGCALAEEADVVLFGLDLEGLEGRRVLRAHHRHHPTTPIVIAAPAHRYVDVLARIPNRTVLRTPASIAGQVRALWSAVFARRGLADR